MVSLISPPHSLLLHRLTSSFSSFSSPSQSVDIWFRIPNVLSPWLLCSVNKEDVNEL